MNVTTNPYWQATVIRSQRGFTIIELMVGILVSFIVVAAAFSMYSVSVNASSQNVKAARLHHELQSIMDLMTSDIRRAGYWNATLRSPAAASNPHMDGIGALRATTPGCILYSYDNERATPASVPGNGGNNPANAEMFGFKLVGGEVQMRKSCDTPGISCNCTEGTWEAISDSPAIVIDRLTFSVANSQCKVAGSAVKGCTGYVAATQVLPTATGSYVETRQVDIVLSGHLANDPTISKVMRSTVKVRNDHIFTR